MNAPTYTNISDRYGDAATVTLEDYENLNAFGVFEEREDGIYELVDSMGQSTDDADNGNWQQIAERQ